MKKICFVIQRYGDEVNGGAETLCKQLAERMTDRYDVSVLTTKAIDYMTWKDEYTADEETISGVKIRRFSVNRKRNINMMLMAPMLPTVSCGAASSIRAATRPSRLGTSSATVCCGTTTASTTIVRQRLL